MKTIYVAPLMEQMTVQIEHIISESTTTQGVHTDNPQPPSNALVKEDKSYNVWDDDWSK